MTSATEPHHDRFTIERVYPNCREHVWSAWSSPGKKRRWFGDGLEKMSFEVGGLELGRFRDGMGEHVNEGRYFEINPSERIVLAYSMALNGRVHTVSLATITFADESGGTRVTYTEQMVVIPPSDGVAGRQHGWGALLDSMERFLEADTRLEA
jgi:uncharacterized protein YndB with AHSA1/START domain